VFEVFLERAAEADLKRLSKENFNRLIPHIRFRAQDPRPSGCRKLSGSPNDWRNRIGDYRVLYEIDDKRKTVKVFRVKHRREAYR
jgi:mRNA interferase RelE/StbE